MGSKLVIFFQLRVLLHHLLPMATTTWVTTQSNITVMKVFLQTKPNAYSIVTTPYGKTSQFLAKVKCANNLSVIDCLTWSRLFSIKIIFYTFFTYAYRLGTVTSSKLTKFDITDSNLTWFHCHSVKIFKTF